ncbi:MAG: CelD/BcsL family acetyltransferase involved in cellulose biosynthesis [Verrucomicrobiales bacterium]|jgi:CelD/BcsL family acetyltransferase involved in cellulose biosynthesis
MSAQFEIIRDVAGLDALESEWNALLQRSSADSVFMTFEYIRTWWRAYGKNFKLYLITARDPAADGKLIGIAPLMVGRGHGFARKRFRHLTFIGGLGDALAEYQDFIVQPGSEAELLLEFYTRINEDLRGEWDLMFLGHVDENSPAMQQLLATIPKFGYHTMQLTSRPSPHIPLPDSWDELLKSKSKNFKKQFNNQWNRLHKRHEVEWLTAGEDIGMDEAFKILIDLNHKRWGSKGQAFQSPEFNGFHRELSELFAKRGWLFFRLMKLDGQFVAARYDFVYGGKLWNYQNGWLPELSKLSLGKMVIGYSVKWCIEQGLREYDFLAGATPYKKSWATDVRYLVNVEISNPASRWAFAFQQLRLVKSLMSPAPREFMKGEAA